MKTVKLNLRSVLTAGLVLILVSLLSPQAATAKVPLGTDPNYAIPLTLAPHEVSFNPGTLAPGQEMWYAIKVTELEGESRQPLDLSLFATPGDGNAIQNVTMDLFPGSYAGYWSVNNLDDVTSFGTGRIVEQDGDGEAFMGELIWSGDVNNNEVCLVRIRNDNTYDVAYWLLTDYILDAEFGDADPAITTIVAPGTDPNNALPLANSVNWGELGPDSDRWYAMQKSDLDDDMFERMDLSFYFTPNDGNNLHRIHFDVFDASQRQIWSRGTFDDMVNMGAGSIEARDNNDETSELFWSGWLVDNDMYYVRVRNRSAGTIN